MNSPYPTRHLEGYLGSEIRSDEERKPHFLDGIFEFFSGRPTHVSVEGVHYNIEPIKPAAIKLPPDTLMIDESLRLFKLDKGTADVFNEAVENNVNDGIFTDFPAGTKPTHAIIYGKFYSLTPRR